MSNKTSPNLSRSAAAVHRGDVAPSKTHTPVDLQLGPKSASGPEVEYIRVPGPDGVDPIFSMNRDTVLDLVLPRARNGYKPPVKSVVIKSPGMKRGRRFVSVQSLRSYFSSLEAQAS